MGCASEDSRESVLSPSTREEEEAGAEEEVVEVEAEEVDEVDEEEVEEVEEEEEVVDEEVVEEEEVEEAQVQGYAKHRDDANSRAPVTQLGPSDDGARRATCDVMQERRQARNRLHLDCRYGLLDLFRHHHLLWAPTSRTNFFCDRCQRVRCVSGETVDCRAEWPGAGRVNARGPDMHALSPLWAHAHAECDLSKW
jgi:hypothetical protein